MNGIFQKKSLIFVSSLFLFSFVFGGASDQLVEKPASEKQSLSDLVSYLFKENKERLKGLNYFTSKGITLKLPNNNELDISWGDVGSGDVLSPFYKIETELRAGKDSADNKNGEQVSTLATLAKLLLRGPVKNVLTNYTKDIPALDWISSLDHNAFSPFIIKLLLLGMHPFEKGQEIRRNVEAIRLFFRLAQSGFFRISDPNKSLLSYLPKEVADFIEQNISKDFKKFIDEAWEVFGKKFKEYNFDVNGAYDVEKLGVYTTGYVFTDPKIADECFEKLNKIKKAKPELFTSDLFEEELEKLKPSSYEVVEINDFSKHKENSNYRFIGHNGFGRISKDSVAEPKTSQDNYLPEKIKTEVLSASSNPKEGSKILKVAISDKETWLLYVSPKLTFLDTLKLAFVGILKGYDEFKQIRAQNLALADTEELKKAKLSDQEIEELKDLYVQRNRLKEVVSFADSKIKQAFKVLQDKKSSAEKDKLSQDLLKIDQKKYDQLVAGSKEARENLEKISKRINELEEKANDILLSFTQDDKTVGKNIAKLFMQAFVSSPELKSMFDAFSGKDAKYSVVRKNLLKRLAYIFRNSENFSENLEIYRYIILYMFPDFKDQLDKLIKSEELNKNKTGVFDAVLTSLGL